MKRWFPVLSLCVFGAMAPAPASASPDGNALIEEGVELRRKGRDTEALEKFSEAYEVSQSPRALAQVALAEQALGLWPQALRHLEDALGSVDDLWITTNRKVLEESLAMARDRVGGLDIRCSVPNATVRFNGRDLGKLPFTEPVFVAAGSGVLEVTAPQHRPLIRAINVVPRELTRETVELVAEPTAVASTGSTPSEEPAGSVRTSAGRSNLELAGWITGGVGVLAVGGGVAAYLVREQQAKKWNDDTRCLLDGRTRRENCAKNADAVKSAETLMAVGFIAGGVLGAASAVFFAMSPSDAELNAVPTSAGPSVRLLACGSGPGAIGVSCAAQF